MPLFFSPLALKGGISKDIYLLQAPPLGVGGLKSLVFHWNTTTTTTQQLCRQAEKPM